MGKIKFVEWAKSICAAGIRTRHLRLQIATNIQCAIVLHVNKKCFSITRTLMAHWMCVVIWSRRCRVRIPAATNTFCLFHKFCFGHNSGPGGCLQKIFILKVLYFHLFSIPLGKKNFWDRQFFTTPCEGSLWNRCQTTPFFVLSNFS